MIDFLSALVLAAFGARGWSRGTKPMVLWALSLVVGSVAGALLARPVGAWLAPRVGLPLLAAVPLAGLVAAGLATGLVRSAAQRASRARASLLEAGWQPPPWDPWGGASVGVLCGTGFVLVAAWVGIATGRLHGHEDRIRASLVGRTAVHVGEPAIRLLAGGAVDNTVMAATVAYLMSDPRRAEETLGALVRDPRVRELASDPGVREELAAADAGALSRAPALRALAADAAFVTAARRVRILPEADAPTVSPEELAGSVAERLGPLLRALDMVAKDPEVQALVADPEFRDALARGDLTALLAKGRLDGIARRVTAELERGR